MVGIMAAPIPAAEGGRPSLYKARSMSGSLVLSETPEGSDKMLLHEVLPPKSERLLGTESRRPALSWVEGDRFQAAVTVLLLTNAVQLATEVDSPNWFGWQLFEFAFLAAFVAELSLRLAFRGGMAWIAKDPEWSIFEIALVVLGLLEACCLVVLDTSWREGARSDNSLLNVLKMCRLGRIFRVFRLLPRLALFLKGLVGMMKTFLWVFSLLFLSCLVLAIMCTTILKPHILSGEEGEDMDMIRLRFGDVRSSFFTLFQLTTQDNWCDFALPVVAVMPAFRLFFAGFIMLCSWTMIAMLTAVASDSMLEATCDRKEKERVGQSRKQEAFIKYLKKCFKEGDVDGSGDMDRNEFEALVKQPHVIREMKALGSGLTEQELHKAWAMLDFQDTGVLTIEAFVEGISYLMDTLSTRHILNLDGKVKRCGFKLGRTLAKLSDELNCVMKQNQEIMKLCHEEELWREDQAARLAVWKKWAAQNDRRSYRSALDQCKLRRRRLSTTDPFFDEHEHG